MAAGGDDVTMTSPDGKRFRTFVLADVASTLEGGQRFISFRFSFFFLSLSLSLSLSLFLCFLYSLLIFVRLMFVSRQRFHFLFCLVWFVDSISFHVE